MRRGALYVRREARAPEPGYPRRRGSGRPRMARTAVPCSAQRQSRFGMHMRALHTSAKRYTVSSRAYAPHSAAST